MPAVSIASTAQFNTGKLKTRRNGWNVCFGSSTLVKVCDWGYFSGRLFCWIMHTGNEGQNKRRNELCFQTLLLYLQTYGVCSFWSDPPHASCWMSSLTTECHFKGFFFFVIVFRLNRNNRDSCTVAVLANVGSTWQSAIVFLCHYNHSEFSENCYASHKKYK